MINFNGFDNYYNDLTINSLLKYNNENWFIENKISNRQYKDWFLNECIRMLSPDVLQNAASKDIIHGKIAELRNALMLRWSRI